MTTGKQRTGMYSPIPAEKISANMRLVRGDELPGITSVASSPSVASKVKIPPGRADHYPHGTYARHGYGAIIDDRYDAADDLYDLQRLHTVYKTPRIYEREHFYNIRVALDQGDTPHACAYAVRHFLTASPNQALLGPSASEIYTRARTIYSSRESGAQRPVHFEGVPLRDAIEVIRQDGIIDNYYRLRTVAEVRHWLLGLNAPVMMAAPWTADLARPLGTPFAEYANCYGPVQQTTAFLLIGWSDIQNAVRVCTSLGPTYGNKGRVWVMREGLELLLSQGAQAYTAVKKVFGPDAKARVASRSFNQALSTSTSVNGTSLNR